MKSMHMVSFLLVIIGALNWGLVGLFSFNLVDTLFGFESILSRLVYILVGIAGVYLLATHKEACKACAAGMGQNSGAGNSGSTS